MFKWIRNLFAPDDESSPVWVVEIDGREIGELHNPRLYEMFYDTYDMEPYSAEGRSLMFDPDIWYLGEHKLRFRKKDSNYYAENAFAGRPPEYICKGKINMRALR